VTHALPLLLLVLAGAAPAPTAPPAPAPARQVVDRVAAIVNGDVITLSDLVARSGTEWERIEKIGPGVTKDRERADLLRRVLDLVIAERLLQAEAATLQVDASPQQVDQAIAEIKERNHFDEATFQEALREQGLEMTAFRAQIKRDLDTYLVLQYRLRNRVKISEEDLRNYYQSHPREFGGEEEVKVRHLYLPIPPGADDAAREKVRAEAAALAERARKGEDFAALAKEYSKGPSAGEGGDLGWLRRGTLDKAFEDVAFALEAGKVSNPVAAGPGWHVVKVDERRVGGGRSFDEAKEQIRERLFAEQADGYRQQYIADLRRQALIELKLPELQDAPSPAPARGS
jgi:peptidyl-prolyl cis-trans isomerase SurA